MTENGHFDIFEWTIKGYLRVSINGGTASSLVGLFQGKSQSNSWMITRATRGTPISGKPSYQRKLGISPSHPSDLMNTRKPRDG